MKRPSAQVLTLTLLLALLAASRLLAADEPLAGDWVGGFEEGNDYVFLQLHFKSDDGKTVGTYDAPLLFQRGRSLKQVSVESSTVKFEVPSKPDSRLFIGELKDDTLTGQVKTGAAERPCGFHRVAPINVAKYVGTYEIENGHFVFIRAAVEMGIGALQFIDFTTGRVGVLLPKSATDFITGPAVLVFDPIEARVTFRQDGQGEATGLEWAGTVKWSGRRVKLRQEEVSFANDPVTISGALVTPMTPPPHPVVICVAGGTAAGTREMFRHMAEFFALRGVASLIYDKRGLGKSTGDWLRAGFDELAGDALAAVRMLKARPGIDAQHIGLFGASQSGWIVALAASRSKDVDFIISQSGPGVGPAEQELYRSEAWLRADGFSEDDIRDAMTFIRQRYQCALTGVGWDALAETERTARNKSWFVYTGGQAGKESPFWHFWSLIRGYDPVPDLEKVTCPVLAVFGAKDTFLPAEKSAGIWKTALEKAGNKDVTVRMFPDADHSLIESKTGGLKEAARARRFVSGFFELLREWTLAHVK